MSVISPQPILFLVFFTGELMQILTLIYADEYRKFWFRLGRLSRRVKPVHASADHKVFSSHWWY